MSILQAASYYVLYKDLDKEESFGLKRAIFYAWVKNYKWKKESVGGELKDMKVPEESI
jgi:hypothetical protein